MESYKNWSDGDILIICALLNLQVVIKTSAALIVGQNNCGNNSRGNKKLLQQESEIKIRVPFSAVASPWVTGGLSVFNASQTITKIAVVIFHYDMQHIFLCGV